MAREGKQSYTSLALAGGAGALATIACLGGLIYWALTAPDVDEDEIDAAQYADGELDKLPERLRTGCGEYFADQGLKLIFILKSQQVGNTITDIVFVMSKSSVKITLDDSLETPKAHLIDTQVVAKGVEVALSSKDLQRAQCLSVQRGI